MVLCSRLKYVIYFNLKSPCHTSGRDFIIILEPSPVTRCVT